MKEKTPLQKIKIALLSIGSFIIALVVILLSVFKFSHPFKPAFYNYKSYMSKTNIDKIQKDFTYKTFDEINEFTNALVNNKAIAGIGSDFQAIDLIKKGHIKKIDFKKLFKSVDHANFDEELLNKLSDTQFLANVLKEIYSPIVFNHLASYDDELTTDIYGKKIATPAHLWEYFIPYYAQDGMIAYNKSKAINDKEINDNALIDNANALSEQYQTTIQPYSLLNELNLISKSGYGNYIITDAIRTNMLYASGYDFQNNKLTLEPFTGTSTEQNYKNQIVQFGNLIQAATSYPISNSRYITLDGDGQNIVARLLDPSNKQTDSGIVYNGDMLDMYYSDNNYDTVSNGTVEGLKIGQNVLLVDGIVIRNDVDSNYETKLYKTLNESVLENLTWHFSKTNNSIDLNQTYKRYSLKIYQDYLDSVLKPIFKDIAKYAVIEKRLIDLYSETLDDINKLNLYDEFVSDELLNDNLIKQNFILYSDKLFKTKDINHLKELIINLINHVDLANEQFAPVVAEKYANLNNFDFINYTPTTYLDYLFIKRNYFIEDNKVDQKALAIYEIEDKNGIKHFAIKGVSEELLSQISTFYFTQYKG
ncbi:hypothetical protein ACNQ2A_01970 [Mycoplasma sp. 1458C]|uniref:hypothetical protein n=1 Tax=unclassified Mycoplasma TaxID=2683645 RepID=UPI003AAF94C0